MRRSPPKGITVYTGNKLTIEGAGELVAGGYKTTDQYAAGIGGDTMSYSEGSVTGGTIIINGGTITATGSNEKHAWGGTGGAGIGGSVSGSCEEVVINGGTVIAKGGKYAAGIGGGGMGEGALSSGGKVTITGGTVTATGGDVAAGIGSGAAGETGGTTTITGGTVTAMGGDYVTAIESESGIVPLGGGAGIGAGGYYIYDEEWGSLGDNGGTLIVGGDAVVKATGGVDKVGAFGATDGIGVGSVAKKESQDKWSSTLTINSGRWLYGSQSDIGMDVEDAESFLSGEVESYAGDRFQYMVVNGNEQHNFTYSAEGDTITGTCDVGSCSLEDNKITLTIVAPEHSTYGDAQDAEATLSGLEAFNVTGLDISESDIAYAKSDGSSLSAAPTDAGDYKASITAGGVTANVSYTVAKATPALSYTKTSLTKTYGNKAFTNPLTNKSKVKVSYKSSNTKVASVDSAGKVTPKAVGSATITASFAGDAGRKTASASYKLTVKDVRAPAVTCGAHLQGKGDVAAITAAGGKVGTVGIMGQFRRIEAFTIKLGESFYSCGIRYMAHIQGMGWKQGWKANGAVAGTKGQAKRIEAIRIELTGDLAKHYDVWYCAHCQSHSWMGWAKNGAGAGTTGQSKRMEAYQIVLLPKGSKAPGSMANAFHGKL